MSAAPVPSPGAQVPVASTVNAPVPVETYGDIVWKQFRKNTLAYAALWSLLPLVAVAIYAPLIGSNQPLVYDDGARRQALLQLFDDAGKDVLTEAEFRAHPPAIPNISFAQLDVGQDGSFSRSEVPSARIYPWFRSLFNAAEQVDLLFNMALLASPLWLALAVVQNVFWARAGLKWRMRVARGAAQFIALTLGLYALFGGLAFEPTPWAPGETRAWLTNKLQLTCTPWLLALLVQIPFWKRAGMSVPARGILATCQFAALLAGLCLVFSGKSEVQAEAIQQVLDAQQLKAFNQISLPQRDVSALARPDVAQKLGLTPEQQSEVQRLKSQTARLNWLFWPMQIVFLPWLLSLAAQFGGWKSLAGRPQVRIALAVAQFAALMLAVSLAWIGPELRPNNQYGSRDFSVEDFESKDKQQGWYVLVPYGPLQQDLAVTFEGPMMRKPQEQWTDMSDRYPHLLGTDDAGRDVFVRMLYGTRISITVGLVAVGIYLAIGSVVGAIAGYFGGWIDILINRVIEVVLVFPSFFLILTLVAMLGANIYLIMMVIGITSWPGIARLVRGEVLKQRSSDYVTAARALGLSSTRIIFRHILPNSLSPVLVAAPFGVAGAIITEAGLSLLGFGVQPPAPTWGVLLRLGSQKYDYWWLVLFAALAIFLTVLIFNLIGSGLRDAMDPKLRSTR